MTGPRRVVVLGATGSIGTQTLDVARRLGPERVRLVGLAARRNAARLDELARDFDRPRTVVTERDGDEALIELAGDSCSDTVIVAVAGAAGLAATLAACRAGKRVCIATKEVLVAAGALVTATARAAGAELLPIDSEHSALFQCLQGYRRDAIDRLYLTASGGPFRTWPQERIAQASVEEALRHPTWRMGGKITIDSATLMNKGLEIIEACWLFGVEEARVEVVVHPQSVVHSLVELRDGALLAQLGLPDMRLPIQIALLYPEKVDSGLPRLRLAEVAALTFEEPDHVRFPAIGLAREAMRRGGTAPAALNAANEAAVAAFLDGNLSFGEIGLMVRAALDAHATQPADTLEAVLAADHAARAFVGARLGMPPAT